VRHRDGEETERERDDANGLMNRYRTLCRNANGRPLAFGLWLARIGCAIRDVFKAGPDKRRWPM